MLVEFPNGHPSFKELCSISLRPVRKDRFAPLRRNCMAMDPLVGGGVSARIKFSSLEYNDVTRYSAATRVE
jgi:hypothetical protein